MRPLPETFRKDGFDLTLVRRDGNKAIYAKSKPGYLDPSYEVGIIRQNPARFAFGKQLEASESWPTSEEWGVKGWTYTNLSDSVRRLESLHGPNAGKVKSPKTK